MGLLLLLCWQGAYAQTHLISDVKVNQSSVYVGQPVEVTVAVYTSTWFTRGLDPGNIQVNGAFTVYFRSVSSSKQISGKTYAGVEMIFNLFPYEVEDIFFPSLEIRVETPDEGGYKGVSRTVKTQERKITVMPAPPGTDESQWLVASGVTVQEHWSGDRGSVKVGDVLERTIKREASGTVAQLIPPIQWDSLPVVSLYPSRSEVNNQQTRTAISASRSDGVRYLFEREGEVEIPEKVLTWWNPLQKRFYKSTLPGYTIEVLPNPDLGMLESVRDSLAIQTAGLDDTTGEDANLTIWGISWERFIAGFISLVLMLIFLVYGIRLLRGEITKRRELYRRSELFYFRSFKKISRHEDTARTVAALYRWIDHLGLKEPNIQYFVTNFGTDQMAGELEMFESYYSSKSSLSIKLNLRAWSKARKNYLSGNLQIPNSGEELWINP